MGGQAQPREPHLRKWILQGEAQVAAVRASLSRACTATGTAKARKDKLQVYESFCFCRVLYALRGGIARVLCDPDMAQSRILILLFILGLTTFRNRCETFVGGK